METSIQKLIIGLIDIQRTPFLYTYKTLLDCLSRANPPSIHSPPTLPTHSIQQQQQKSCKVRSLNNAPLPLPSSVSVFPTTSSRLGLTSIPALTNQNFDTKKKKSFVLIKRSFFTLTVGFLQKKIILPLTLSPSQKQNKTKKPSITSSSSPMATSGP